MEIKEIYVDGVLKNFTKASVYINGEEVNDASNFEVNSQAVAQLGQNNYQVLLDLEKYVGKKDPGPGPSTAIIILHPPDLISNGGGGDLNGESNTNVPVESVIDEGRVGMNLIMRSAATNEDINGMLVDVEGLVMMNDKVANVTVTTGSNANNTTTDNDVAIKINNFDIKEETCIELYVDGSKVKNKKFKIVFELDGNDNLNYFSA